MKGASRHMRADLSPRAATLRAALRIAKRSGIPPEEVFERHRAGLRWCGKHGWEDKEAERLCRNADCLARYHARKAAKRVPAPGGPI